MYFFCHMTRTEEGRHKSAAVESANSYARVYPETFIYGGMRAHRDQMNCYLTNSVKYMAVFEFRSSMSFRLAICRVSNALKAECSY